MKSELSKRIARLEVRGFAPAEIRLACKNYMAHDILPRNPRLRQIVEHLLQVQQEIEANANGLDHDHPTAP